MSSIGTLFLLLFFFCISVVSTALNCSSSPCLNGVCTEDNTESGYRCFCLDGFTGKNCDQIFDECLPGRNRCQNNATCLNAVPESKCICPPGYCGKLCEAEIDDCASSPCQNGGMCHDRHLGYQCLCSPGYSGDRCEVDVDACKPEVLKNLNLTQHCENGGTCVDGPGEKYFCICPLGYSGHRCEVVLDECSNEPCLNGGRCEKLVGGFNCICAYGWSGPLCDRPLQPCITSHCLNNALCMEPLEADPENPKFHCYCPPDYHGPSCEHQYNECSPNNCRNNGTCIDGVDGYTCSCSGTFAGQHCEVNCEESPEAEVCLAPTTTSSSEVPTPTPTSTQSIPIETVSIEPSIPAEIPTSTMSTPTIPEPESTIETSPTVTPSASPAPATPSPTEVLISPSPTASLPSHSVLDPAIRTIFAPSFNGQTSQLVFRVRRLKRHSTTVKFDLITSGSTTSALLYANTSKYHLELLSEQSQLKAKLWTSESNQILHLQNSFPLEDSTRYTISLSLTGTSPKSVYAELSILNGTDLLSSVSAMGTNLTVPCFECYQFGSGVTGSSHDTSGLEGGSFNGCILNLDINGESKYPKDALQAINITECSKADLCNQMTPCRNNGTCGTDGSGSWSCRCPTGFSGWLCEEARCTGDYCSNGGLCLVTDNAHLCVCTAGFSGPRCAEKMNLTFPLFNIGPNSSYIKYRLPFDIKEFFEIRFRFISHEHNQKSGLLMFMSEVTDGRSTPIPTTVSSNSSEISKTGFASRDFVSLTYESKNLVLRLNLGQGERLLKSPIETNITEQMVLFGRFHQTFWLLVVPAHIGHPDNSLAPQVGRMPLHHRYLNVDPYLYVGGHEDWSAHPALGGSVGFKGCIYDIDLRNTRSANFTRLGDSLIDNLVNIHQCDFECA